MWDAQGRLDATTSQGVTAAQVDKGTKPDRYGDGAGLYLLLRSREAKFWLLRYKRGGRMREMGLGPAVGRTAVSLSAVRVKARELLRWCVRGDFALAAGHHLT